MQIHLIFDADGSPLITFASGKAAKRSAVCRLSSRAQRRTMRLHPMHPTINASWPLPPPRSRRAERHPRLGAYVTTDLPAGALLGTYDGRRFPPEQLWEKDWDHQVTYARRLARSGRATRCGRSPSSQRAERHRSASFTGDGEDWRRIRCFASMLRQIRAPVPSCGPLCSRNPPHTHCPWGPKRRQGES